MGGLVLCVQGFWMPKEASVCVGGHCLVWGGVFLVASFGKLNWILLGDCLWQG